MASILRAYNAALFVHLFKHSQPPLYTPVSPAHYLLHFQCQTAGRYSERLRWLGFFFRPRHLSAATLLTAILHSRSLRCR